MGRAKKDSENISDDPILIIANKIPRESPSQVQNLYKSVVNIFTVKADLKFTTTKIFHSKSKIVNKIVVMKKSLFLQKYKLFKLKRNCACTAAKNMKNWFQHP